MDADRLTSNLADVSVDWAKHIASNDYSFVAASGAGAADLADNAIRIDDDRSPIESFVGDSDTIGLVLVENRLHADGGEGWSLEEATDFLNASGYSISAVIRDRQPVESLSISARSLGEVSTKTYGLEVRPMVIGDQVVLSQRLKEVEEAAEIEALRRGRLEDAERSATNELGEALARMRRYEGWLEVDRRDTMERRALVAERRLVDIEGSWTWRIGSAILWLPRKIAQLFGRSSK
jgi:hypothetical protein